jgi:hypothetical protein
MNKTISILLLILGTILVISISVISGWYACEKSTIKKNEYLIENNTPFNGDDNNQDTILHYHSIIDQDSMLYSIIDNTYLLESELNVYENNKLISKEMHLIDKCNYQQIDSIKRVQYNSIYPIKLRVDSILQRMNKE